MWWGIALAAVGATRMWLLLDGAIINTIMFLVVSIPMQDRRQSRKDGYGDYKASTRMLLPIPKRKRA